MTYTGRSEVDAISHYGIIGMKWGIRRTPEQLGHAPKEKQKEFRKGVRADEKEYRRLRRDVTAAQKNLQSRTRAADRDKKDVARAEKVYERAIAKREPILSSKKKIERQNAIDHAEKFLNQELEFSERSEGKRRQAKAHAKESIEKLEKFINEMDKKYGAENVKQLERKDVTTGALWWKKTQLENGFNTGVNMANAPLIGRAISASIINNMERSDRAKIMDERLDDKDRKKYA